MTARDKDGSTPLHCAAWNGREQVAAILLDAGAEVRSLPELEVHVSPSDRIDAPAPT